MNNKLENKKPDGNSSDSFEINNKVFKLLCDNLNLKGRVTFVQADHDICVNRSS